MITISLCMIVKNEEDTLPRCLSSILGAVDEIIIVDTGSTDNTKKAAWQYTDKVFDFEWQDDFSKARNFAFSLATMDYCMWMDADDVIEKDEFEKLLKLKQTLSPDTDVVMMKYNTSFDESGRPIFTYYRERLIRRGAGLLWCGAVHESIAPSGKIIYSEIAVTHKKTKAGDSERNLRIFEKMISRGQKLAPREMFYYARELTYHGRDREASEIFEDFISSGAGWKENVIEALLNLSGVYRRLGDRDKSFSALVKSFAYDKPRAEICCEIGKHFFDMEEYDIASFWYERALSCKRRDKSGGFVMPDCYDYIPAMQLCVCCYRLGNIDRAERYNELAGRVKPEDASYLYNRDFFEAERRNRIN